MMASSSACFQFSYAISSSGKRTISMFHEYRIFSPTTVIPILKLQQSTTVNKSVRSFHGTRSRTARQPILQDLDATDIVCIWNNGTTCLMGDEIVNHGPVVLRRLQEVLPNNAVANKGTVVGFAGKTEAALAILDKLEAQLVENDMRADEACVELAKQWRRDSQLRFVEGALFVANKSVSQEVNVQGNVVGQYDGIVGVGRGRCVIAIAKVLMDNPELTNVDARVANKSMDLASDLFSYPHHDSKYSFVESIEMVNYNENDNRTISNPSSTAFDATMIDKPEENQVQRIKSFDSRMKEFAERRKKGLAKSIKKAVVDHVRAHKQAEQDRKQNLAFFVQMTVLGLAGTGGLCYLFIAQFT